MRTRRRARTFQITSAVSRTEVHGVVYFGDPLRVELAAKGSDEHFVADLAVDQCTAQGPIVYIAGHFGEGTDLAGQRFAVEYHLGPDLGTPNDFGELTII